MVTHVLKGTKQQIAETLARFDGHVHAAIVFVEEPAAATNAEPAATLTGFFDEMRPYMVEADGLDDSRESIYSPAEGE